MKINYYYDFGKKLLRPILRSITGSGVRKTNGNQKRVPKFN